MFFRFISIEIEYYALLKVLIIIIFVSETSVLIISYAGRGVTQGRNITRSLATLWINIATGPWRT